MHVRILSAQLALRSTSRVHLLLSAVTRLCVQMASSTDQQQQNGAPEHFGNGAAEHVPIVEVAFAHGKWWSIPEGMSRQLYAQCVNQQDAGYTWDWGEGGRRGSWTPDGEETRINRYVIDFTNFVQTDVDNQRKRSINIVWVRPQDVQARFTGELPSSP